MDSGTEEHDPASGLSSLESMQAAILTAISHELRTPLASILGFSMTLLEAGDGIDLATRADMLERIVRNARRLQRAIEALTDVDRLSRGLFSVHRVETNVGDLVRQVIESDPAMRSSRLHIDAEVTFVADPAKLERIIESLLSNALKYTPPGSPVTLTALPHPGGLLIVVDDEGPGVPEAFRIEIFQPFRQGPGTVSHSPGMGLGLPLVAGFAKLHGGRAWVEPTESGGASFRVFLAEPPARPD